MLLAVNGTLRDEQAWGNNVFLRNVEFVVLENSQEELYGNYK